MAGSVDRYRLFGDNRRRMNEKQGQKSNGGDGRSIRHLLEFHGRHEVPLRRPALVGDCRRNGMDLPIPSHD
jgi:hypothetical protein